jgi:hypothetical protein
VPEDGAADGSPPRAQARAGSGLTGRGAQAKKPPPLRLVAPEPSERDIHVTVADLLDVCLGPPALWMPYPAGVTTLTARQHAQYSRFGIKRGVPDILIFYNRVWGIELKRRGGRLSKTRVARTRSGAPRILVGQDEMFDKLLGTGAWGAIEVAHSVDEVIDLLDFWDIPRRGGGVWRRLGRRPQLAET